MGGRRVDWVDAAKGLSIILVVMMHSTLGVEREMGASGWLGPVVAFAEAFRMPAFFLVSGLFLSRTLAKDLATFLDRRVMHFLYFYVLWLTIQFAFKAPGFLSELGAAGLGRLYLESLVLQPFGTLWFIFILPFFALAVRLMRGLPAGLVLAGAALLSAAPIATGSVVIDEFCARFVYFFAGYAFAPTVFAFADAVRTRPAVAAGLLGLWGAAHGLLVATGWTVLPGVALVVGFAGTAAVVAVAALLSEAGRLGAGVRFIGSRSIVIYLAFFLPMAIARQGLAGSGLDVGAVSALVTAIAVTVPLLLEAGAMRLGAGFLFERPRWARLPTRPLTAAGAAA